MTVWIVIIISGLMTNIHEPLTVVVPCLSAGPCGLVSGLFQSVSAHHNQSQFQYESGDCSDLNTMMMMMSVRYLGHRAKPLELVMELAPGMRPGVWSADHGAHHDINTSAPAAQRESRALPGYISNCDMAPPSDSNGILRQRMRDRNTEGLEVIITSIPARGKDTICLETAR